MQVEFFDRFCVRLFSGISVSKWAPVDLQEFKGTRVGDTLRDTLAHTLDIPLTKTRYSSPDSPVDCFAIPRSCGGQKQPEQQKSPLPDPVWLRAEKREIAYREFRDAG